MDHWSVEKEGDADSMHYTFRAKDISLGVNKVREIGVWVFMIPGDCRTEIHARTPGTEMYKAIVQAGKAHALEQDAACPEAEQYYFDSSYTSLSDMPEGLLDIFLSDHIHAMSFLEGSLLHIASCDDGQACVSKTDEAIRVLATADQQVMEICDYINQEYGHISSLTLPHSSP